MPPQKVHLKSGVFAAKHRSFGTEDDCSSTHTGTRLLPTLGCHPVEPAARGARRDRCQRERRQGAVAGMKWDEQTLMFRLCAELRCFAAKDT